MENTTKAGTFNLLKKRIMLGVISVTLTLIISHVPILGQYFPVAIALIAYAVSKNTINIYLIVPAAIATLPYIPKGYDPWGDLAAMCFCGFLFVAARRIKLRLWQSASVAASLCIICNMIYRFATATVYKIELESFILEAFIVFAMFFVFDALYNAMPSLGLSQSSKKAKEGALQNSRSSQLSLVALGVASILLVCGTGFEFFLWPVILFICLCGLTYFDLGQTLLVIMAMGVSAALVEQAQWGVMTTMLIGACAASFAKKFGIIMTTIIFTAACGLFNMVESGLVLGVEKYSLFFVAVVFLLLNWKFGAVIKKFMKLFIIGRDTERDEANSKAEDVLKKQADEMGDLVELYSTYIDNRSILANQFSITQQIIEAAGLQIGQCGKHTRRFTSEKFDMDIAVSQCAAAGTINGDCCGWQDLGDSRIAMVISDGMGKGKKAATESLMATKTIVSLLKAGVTADLTLKMINTIMLMKDDEDSFATVDLIIVDRKSTKAKFYKIGAAPTLIRRKNNVEEVQLSAVPLGIVNGLKVRYVEATLKKDDWIIMMSDGVSDGGDGHGFLQNIKEIAVNVKSADPQTMCDLILNQASDSYIGKERDDLTVMVGRIV